MHELSLVRCLLGKVEQLLADNDAESANVIHIQIGALSGVEPELVRSAFDQCGTDTKWSDTELQIETCSLAVRCLDCRGESELEGFKFRCRACGSGHVQVIRGDEFRLLSVSIYEDSPIPKRQ